MHSAHLEVQGMFVGSKLVTLQTLSYSEGGVNPAEVKLLVQAKNTAEEGGAFLGREAVHSQRCSPAVA